MENIRAIKQDEPWRVVVTMEGGEDHILSRASREEADAFVVETFERGFLKLPGSMKEDQDDWVLYVPLHRIIFIEVHEEDPITKQPATRQGRARGFKPGI